MNENIALFDLDCTLCDFEGAKALIKSKMGLTKALKTIEWWATLPKFKLGFDIWDMAGELGYKRLLLTKGPKRLPYAWTGKKLWVDSNLGKENDLNIVSDKGKFYGRVLVDDWPKYVMAWLKHRPRGLVIMPASKANEGFSHPQVIRYDGTNLEEVRKALMKVRKMAELRRVGILGGAFDPCHIGHLKLAEAVLKAGVVDEVWLMPCKVHTYGKAMEPYFHRLKMCELMAGNSPDIKVSDYEGIRGLSGSTLDTFTRLKEEPWSRGIIEYSCIIGLDNANTISNWVKHEELTRQVRFVVVKRQGLKKVRGQWYTKPPHEFMDEDIPDVSSTDARKFLKAWWKSKKTKKIPDGLLHCQVMAYIEKYRLYRPIGWRGRVEQDLLSKLSY